jgi:hypothetical protein
MTDKQGGSCAQWGHGVEENRLAYDLRWWGHVPQPHLVHEREGLCTLARQACADG